MNKFAILLAAAASLCASSSFAQAYVGGAVGISEVDASCDDTLSCDTSDTGFKLYAGYRLGQGFSVSAGIVSARNRAEPA